MKDEIVEAAFQFKNTFTFEEINDEKIKEVIDFIDSKCSNEGEVYQFIYFLMMIEYSKELMIINVLNIPKYGKIIQKNINRRLNYLEFSSESKKYMSDPILGSRKKYKIYLEDEIGCTLLWWALVKRHVKVATKLISYGANYIEDFDDAFFIKPKMQYDCAGVDYTFIKVIEEMSRLQRITLQIKNDICIYYFAKAIQFRRNEILRSLPLSSETCETIKKLNTDICRLLSDVNLSNREYSFEKQMHDLCWKVPYEVAMITVNQRTWPTLLCNAVTYLRFDVVKILIECGANSFSEPYMFDLKEKENTTEEKQLLIVEIMKELIEHDPTSSERFSSKEPLLESAIKYKLNILHEYLVKINFPLNRNLGWEAFRKFKALSEDIQINGTDIVRELDDEIYCLYIKMHVNESYDMFLLKTFLTQSIKMVRVSLFKKLLELGGKIGKENYIAVSVFLHESLEKHISHQQDRNILLTQIKMLVECNFNFADSYRAGITFLMELKMKGQYDSIGYLQSKGYSAILFEHERLNIMR